MDGNSDASKVVCSTNGTLQHEVPCEGWDTLKYPRIGWETQTINWPNVAVPSQDYGRRRPGRPKKNRLPWTPKSLMRGRGRPRKQLDDLTSDLPMPTPTSYFAVLRPERTYERRPLISPPPCKELPKRVLEQSGGPNGRSGKEPTTLCPKLNTTSTVHMLPRVLDFPGPRVLTKAPVAAEDSSTTGLLCSQLDKLQKAAKSGNEEALLLLEQYKAFGKQRHHFSERMLLKCSHWRARSCYSYHCARRTELFTLPGRTTLHRYNQLSSNS